MQRRDFIKVVAGSAVAWPLEARAQQPERVRRIGVLLSATPDDVEFQTWVGAFLQGLQQAGWSIGRNVEIEFRGHGGDTEKARALATELVDLHPDLVVAAGTPSLFAVQQATRTIPILFVNVADPVAQGFVQSLGRPGGNITGFGLEEPVWEPNGCSFSLKLRHARRQLASCSIRRQLPSHACFCRQWKRPVGLSNYRCPPSVVTPTLSKPLLQPGSERLQV